MSLNHQETFSQWIKMGVPLLAGIGLVAVAILHAAFNLPVKQTFRAVGVLVLIQVATYVLIFWLRRRFSHTPRLGIAVSGIYGLLMGVAAFHYGTQLKLVAVQKLHYWRYSLVVIIATLILLVVNPKWKLDQ